MTQSRQLTRRAFVSGTKTGSLVVFARSLRRRLHLRPVPQPDPLEESMRPLLAVSLFALACTLAMPAMAQNKDVSVPILKAPYHLPVFTNEYVTVLKIFIPPDATRVTTLTRKTAYPSISFP